MLARIAYRQFHEQTNIATVTTVLLAEFGLQGLDASQPRQDLSLHGLIQRGSYQEDRGYLLGKALRYLADAGLQWSLVHDTGRTAALRNHIRRSVPDFEFRFCHDIGSAADPGLHLDSAFRDDARLLLVEARQSIRGLPVHVLLVRREGGLCYVMNSHTGQDQPYETGRLAAHLATPIGAGAVAFAGQQYLYTGVAARVWRQ